MTRDLTYGSIYGIIYNKGIPMSIYMYLGYYMRLKVFNDAYLQDL